MLFRSLLCFCILVIANNLQAQQEVVFPYGSTPTIDGVVSPNEWSDANAQEIMLETGSNVRVLFKHDGHSLFFVFQGNLESSIRFPELLFDTRNDKLTSWDTNDWWFHVSATDCEMRGAHSDYSNCEKVRPGWKAEPNMETGGANVDTIEIAIPFEFIEVNAATLPDTIGLALEVTNTFSAWEYWPSSATIDNPSTWANALVQAAQAHVKTDSNSRPHLVWSGSRRVRFQGEHISFIEVRDMLSRRVLIEKSGGVSDYIEVNLDRLLAGSYIATVHTASDQYTEKFLLK